MGYDVRERPFEFSAFPGRLATPFLGAIGAMIVSLGVPWGMAGARVAPAILLVSGAIALFGAGRWLASRGVLGAPAMRERGMNLEATRPGEATTVWLSAHIDTKSQPVPTLVRSAGIVLESIGYLSVLALAVATAFGATADPLYWQLAAIVTLVGAVPVVLSIVGERSPGALDNASGVATVIAAARQLASQRGIGILLTDGEELGLAGARAWTRDRSKVTALNCDGVDDAGGIQVMFSGRRPEKLLEAVARASRATGVAYRARRLIPGVLTDSVAFSDAGLPSVTFSRGSWRSLARVHSRRDDLAHLDGTGIAETATLIATTARETGVTR